MELVNWSGAVFGPGSEWFWSFAQFVVVAVTLVAIYRQLKLQASERAIDQLTEFRRESYSEFLLRYELDVMIAQRDHDDPADIPEAAVLNIGDYWGSYATLARAGHRDPRLVWLGDSTTPQVVWLWIEPFVRRVRTERKTGIPTYEDLEWFAGEMARMDREGGRPAITAETIVRERDRWIALFEDEIRHLEALRTDRPERRSSR